jgi:hypothetical protein
MSRKKYERKNLTDKEIKAMTNKFLDAEIVNPADTIDPDARERVNRAMLKLADNPSHADIEEYISAKKASDPNLPRLRRLLDEE